MNYPPITIRINIDDTAMDWSVQRPDLISFRDTLEAINQALPNLAVPAFEYDDEDGDRITVRSDDEMSAMISYYISNIAEFHAEGIQPLNIYPRAGKSSGKRNVLDLKVKTKDGADKASSPVESPMQQEGSSRKRSGDIQEILACGNIRATDLQKLDVLGSGNCGSVYKAYHRAYKQHMAVKEIPLDISYEAQKQIIAELEILYRCNSPVIIGFYGAYFMENRISICTEYMDGGSLDKYGQIPEHVLGRIAVSVVKGLQYLWSLKIMHRDVKPSNILVNTQGHVKLCDFGVSVQLLSSIAETFIGTNAYMAPERILGHPYSIHSEVWSLGVTLFELSCGRFPYESVRNAAAKPIDLIKSIVEKVPPQLPREMFPDVFVDFVSQCMQKTQEKRPAPQDLMRHPYIECYNDSNTVIVASWVQIKLHEMLQKNPGHNVPNT